MIHKQQKQENNTATQRAYWNRGARLGIEHAINALDYTQSLLSWLYFTGFVFGSALSLSVAFTVSASLSHFKTPELIVTSAVAGSALILSTLARIKSSKIDRQIAELVKYKEITKTEPTKAHKLQTKEAAK